MRFAWWVTLAVIGCVEPIDDHDGDGLITAEDCDDSNAAVGGPVLYYEDLDADGYGSQVSQRACVRPQGWSEVPGDCDDLDEAVNPDTEWYTDADEDDYGDQATAVRACDPLDPSLVRDGTDCNDADDTVHPGAADPFYDGEDDNCDGANDYDADSDGYVDEAYNLQVGGTAPGTDDCDDDDPSVHPNATESWYDGTDTDCDGANDFDADGDTWVESGWSGQAGGTAPNIGDCDDTDPTVWPGSGDDWYDGTDGDCDGANDYDADGDGFVDAAWDAMAGGTAPGTGDCDDAAATTYPGATDLFYDGIDANCDQANDYDADADGYVREGDDARAGGTAPSTGDCDDDTPSTYPTAVEDYYDGVDANCDLANDYDADADGWVRTVDAARAGGTAVLVGDCDDDRGDVNPAQAEIWYDGTDGDCDGWSDWDQDRDGYTQTGAPQGTANDCNDSANWAYPASNHRVPTGRPTIQEAVDALCGTGTVTVGAGLYPENVSVVDAITLRGDDAAEVIIEPAVTGPGLYIEAGTVSGFTVRNGANPGSGGCVEVSDGLQVVVEDLILTGCSALSNGGGLSIDDSSDVTVRNVEVADSTAMGGGGGIAITLSDTLTLTGLDVHDNTAVGPGGGLWVPDGHDVILDDAVFSGNIADSSAGFLTVRTTLTDVWVLGNYGAKTPVAVSMLWSDITGLTVEENWALPGPAQSTVHLDQPTGVTDVVVRANGPSTDTVLLTNAGNGTSGVVRDLWVEGNRSTRSAVHLVDSRLENAFIAGNYAVGLRFSNGGAALPSTVAWSTVVGNGGAGLHLVSTRSGNAFHSTVSAYNGGQGVLVDDQGGGLPTLRASDVWGNTGAAYSGVPDPTGGADNIAQDPLFLSYSSYLPFTAWDLHPAPSSPLLDGGLSTETDPDTTRADIGYWGGPSADQSYFIDSDADTMYDGWELRHGLDTTADDRTDDADADTLSNLDEFLRGTVPTDADTDNDGIEDGAEITAGTNPLNPSG